MTTLLKFVNRFLRRSTFFLLTYPRISHLFDRNHNAMDTKIAKMLAALQEKKARAKARHERRMKAGKASINRRWSAPVAPARRPLGNVDSNRRQSEPPPPPPLASAAAVKKVERNQPDIFTYEEMPKHPGYRRKRSWEPAATAASTMGHAYVDAAVVSSGVASLSQSKCEHCGSRRGWAVAGETKRAIGGGSFDFACVVCGCLRHLPLSSRHGKQQDEATVRFLSATTTEGMGNSHVNRLLTKLDIGAVNNRVYARVVEAVDEAASAEADRNSGHARHGRRHEDAGAHQS